MDLLPPGATFVITAAVIAGPIVLRQIRQAASVAHHDERAAIRSTGRILLTLLVVANAFWILVQLFIHPPSNIFSALRVPFRISIDKLRAILVQHSNPRREELPAHIEALLTKFASFDVRTLYVRFGHDTIVNCDFCENFLDFALFSLTNTLLDYLRHVLLFGLITMRGTGRERLRILGSGILVAAMTFEAYWLYTVDIQWYDRLYTIRQVMFLVLTIVAHNLPPSPAPPPSPLFALQPSAVVLDKAITKLRFLDYARAVSIRDPILRENVEEWWGRQKQETDWALADEHLREEAEKLGLGMARGADNGAEDGKLMSHVRKLVQELFTIAWGVPASAPDALSQHPVKQQGENSYRP